MGEIKKQTINNSVLSYIGALLGFLLIYVQPKLISSSDIGILRLLYSFSWLAATIMPFGMGNITLRFFPRIRNEHNGHNGYFALLLIFASMGAFIIALLMYYNKPFFVEYYKKSKEFPLYFNEAIVFAYILSLISVYTLYTSSLLKTTFTVFLTDVFTRLVQLILVIVYSKSLINRDTLVVLYIGIFLVQLILMFSYLIKIKSVSFKINWSFYKKIADTEILFFGILMMITSFASLGIKIMDQLMIGHFLSEQYVGVYATSVMICVILEIPFNSLDRIAQPKLANAWALKNTKEVEDIYEKSSRYMFFAGGLIFCFLWSCIDLFYTFIPKEYEGGKWAFYIVSFSSLFNLATGVNTSIISLSTKYWVGSILLFVLITISIVANNYLIEPYGITGAAAATLISIGSFNLLKYLYIWYKFKMQPFSLHTIYITIAIVICIVTIMFLDKLDVPFLKAVLGCVVTVSVFSLMNIKFSIIEEVNKVFKKIKLIK